MIKPIARKFGAGWRHKIERFLPERRIFLRSDDDTRFIRLSSTAQLLSIAGIGLFLGWNLFATSLVLMDKVGADQSHSLVIREQQRFEERISSLAAERDLREEEALAAQARYNGALEQVSTIQTRLLQSENRRRELEIGIDVIQSKLRDSQAELELVENALAEARGELNDGEGALRTAMDELELSDTLELVSATLSKTADETVEAKRDEAYAEARAEELELELQFVRDQNNHIFRQLEDAMQISVEPLERMFAAAGLSTDSLLSQVRRGYSGTGGPLTPISYSTTSERGLSGDILRANRILEELDELNLYRIAAARAPFSTPVRRAYRFTSGFGYRRDPKTGGRRMHNGVDFAAPSGTPIHATADGVVTFAGWQSGYGRLIKIQHDFGIETRYAHNSRIRVRAGQRVSRGDHISDMGASGRVTGVHLHYEVRVGGRPVNPMSYIRAADNVF